MVRKIDVPRTYRLSPELVKKLEKKAIDEHCSQNALINKLLNHALKNVKVES